MPCLEGAGNGGMHSFTHSLTSIIDGVGGQRNALAALSPAKRPGTHCTGGISASGSVWKISENLAPIGFRIPNFPALSEPQ
jgi:hypothetical protein